MRRLRSSACNCDACTGFSTKCPRCSLSIARSDLADHEMVCCQRQLETLPKWLRSSAGVQVELICALVAMRKLGSRWPYSQLLVELCLGADTWTLYDAKCMCCSWFRFEQVCWGAYTQSFRFRTPCHVLRCMLSHHNTEHHVEMRCPDCGLYGSRREIAKHDCRETCKPWLEDYELICPGCGETIKKSRYPHANCPQHTVSLLGLATLWFAGQPSDQTNMSSYAGPLLLPRDDDNERDSVGEGGLLAEKETVRVTIDAV